MVLHVQNLVRLCQFILKILSRNIFLMSFKGYNSVEILRKMSGNNTKHDLIILSMLTYTQNLVRFCQFVLKILSGNESLTSFKDCNYVRQNFAKNDG